MADAQSEAAATTITCVECGQSHARIRKRLPRGWKHHGFVFAAWDWPTGFETVRIGQAIALRGYFADPYMPMRTGPTGHHMPVYPLMLAGIYAVFGIGKIGIAVQCVMNGLLISAQLALLPMLASAFDVSIVWGAAGGLAGALIPF